MARHTTLLVAAVLICAALAACMNGCSRLSPGALGVNVPPDTKLTMSPAEGDTTSLRIELSWSGSDEDGRVARFWTRTDGAPWRMTTAAETVLVFRADERSEEGELPTHTFEVRAEDDEGELDPTPASVTFSSRNSLPETLIVDAPPGITTTTVYIEWRGWDHDGIVSGYGWSLGEWDSNAGIWVVADSMDSVGPDVVSVTLDSLFGGFRFQVWSIDNEGGVDPTPAQAEFVTRIDLAPILAVKTGILSQSSFSGPVWRPSYNEPVDIFEGEKLVFDWYASASDYGREIAGYSYAYDDTSNWCTSYVLGDTHFETGATPGEHSLYVAAVDDLGNLTRGRIFLNVVEVSRDYVLVVDDWDHREEWNPAQGWGDDEQRDAFYDTLTASCGRPIVEWEPADHLVGGAPAPPDVAALAHASTVIWYCDDALPVVSRAFDSELNRYAAPAGYVRTGGNLVLCGMRCLRSVTGELYPMSFSASDSDFGGAFVRDLLGIGYAENSGASINKNVPWDYGYCFYGAVPGQTSVPEGGRGLFAPVYIDSVGPGGYPERGKWPVYTFQSPPYSEGYVRAGLPYVEKLQAYGCEPIEVCAIDSYVNPDYEGEACVMLRYTGTHSGNTCYFGFPLYYMQTDQAAAFFEKLLAMFGE